MLSFCEIKFFFKKKLFLFGRLGGLFVYDVFWVFGTDVMVTVAKSFQVLMYADVC